MSGNEPRWKRYPDDWIRQLGRATLADLYHYKLCDYPEEQIKEAEEKAREYKAELDRRAQTRRLK